MSRIIGLLVCLCVLSCDDGDILNIQLDFDKELERCDNDLSSYLIYDLRNDPSESLSLIIPRNETTELLFQQPTPVGTPVEFPINGNTVRFIYRTYNRDIVSTGTTQELCELVPPSDLAILEDYEAGTGSVEVEVTVVDDDNDGIPTAFENADPNGDGDFSDSQDTDGDGIYDYIDEDDDNDNVKTINEIDNSDNDDDPTTNPLDTDNDGTLDYLDDDDDGDGVATILEDADGDRDPSDDIANNEQGELVPHYLNTLENTTYDFPGLADHIQYTRTVNTSFLIKDIDLEILRTDMLDLGILVSTLSLTNN